MGEVYRADDLKLGQPVALKFLPPALAQDSVRRERFFAEVRITRQLSHPNICRVYDIGEVDGRHFLSMEYIDGEDLASLMKRIGHLSNEKALDIARQLVAGLTVAHERGVLHRDLKPANIMLDGHGRVRITDFGLAIAVGDESQTEEIAGTPAYMAPEQLAGKGATVRSDIYSLGLILYEIYTGKKAFKAKTLAELREQKETQIPRAPSEIREGIDPVVERVIQRCMEKDPNVRPASVAQLVQALPGGDPLAAAIATGETPSPEMVAASGSTEGLRPAIAWGLLGIIVVGMLAIIAMNNHAQLIGRIPNMEKPEYLVFKAQQFLKKAGYITDSSHQAHGFLVATDVMRYIEKSDQYAELWKKLGARTILFWYRQSPSSISTRMNISKPMIATDNPPLLESGEILLIFDTKGDLVSFRAIPPQTRTLTGNTAEPDWKVFFNEAGLNWSDRETADAEFTPPSYADTIAAWKSLLLNINNTPVRVEATAFQGKVIGFEIIGKWKEESDQSLMGMRIMGIGFVLIGLIATVGSIFFARRNLRHGRGDRRGAKRLAFTVLVFASLCWMLVFPRISIDLFFLIPYAACLTWVLYIALEPYVRRRWPRVLISWTRLLSGQWKDPLIARDILIGFAVMVAIRGLNYFSFYILPVWLGHRELSLPVVLSVGPLYLLGPGKFIAVVCLYFAISILISLALLCILFLMKILLKNQIAAIIAATLIFSLMNASNNIWSYLILLVLSPFFFIVLLRYGLIAVTASLFLNFCACFIPAFLDPSWYSYYGYYALAIIAALTLFAFRTSLGGRPMFGTPRLDD